MKNYKITYSNFDSDNTEISLKKENVEILNKVEKVNFNETNTKEILQHLLGKNIYEIDYKVNVEYL